MPAMPKFPGSHSIMTEASSIMPEVSLHYAARGTAHYMYTGVRNAHGAACLDTYAYFTLSSDKDITISDL